MLAINNGDIEVIDRQNPEVLLKSVKNATEIANLRDVHIDDGLAVTRFIFWLKDTIRKGVDITEYDAAMYLDGLRSQYKGLYRGSFLYNKCLCR